VGGVPPYDRPSVAYVTPTDLLRLCHADGHRLLARRLTAWQAGPGTGRGGEAGGGDGEGDGRSGGGGGGGGGGARGEGAGREGTGQEINRRQHSASAPNMGLDQSMG
jgi:hypothetical protein